MSDEKKWHENEKCIYRNMPFRFCDLCNATLSCMKFNPEKIIQAERDGELNMPETKPTNPKDALGIKKVPMHCVPSAPLLEVGLAMMEGGRKYGTHNYRDMGVRMSTYYDAVWRHLIAWWENENIDPDSGVHHVVKAIACLFVLRDSMIMGNCEDDRPIKYANGMGMGELNELAAGLIVKYPECAKPFLQAETKERLCHKCSGEGWCVDAGGGGHVCRHCNGKGTVPVPEPVPEMIKRTKCNGTGEVWYGSGVGAKCGICKGTGTVPKLDGRNEKVKPTVNKTVECGDCEGTGHGHGSHPVCRGCAGTGRKQA